MKKFLKSLFVFALIIPCLFLFSGCKEEKSIKIKDISRTAFTDKTVTYTITYEDDTTFSYTIPIENTVSISNIEKTASVRNTDTYTITMSNSQTFTFTVTNGVSISDITYVSNTDGQDCYEVKYSNGTNDYFYIENDTATATLSIEELYETANTDGKYKDILEFIEDYLTINVNSDSKSVATSKAILSAVNITACYPSNSSYYNFSTSRGAGVIYQFDEASDSAYIITNCHVVYYEGMGYSDSVFAYVYGREDSPYEKLSPR